MGNIFLPEIAVSGDSIVETTRTIRITSTLADGSLNTQTLGWNLGNVTVRIGGRWRDAANLIGELSIDIITSDNPTLAAMFSGIHVDFTPLRIASIDTLVSGRYYPNLTVSGTLTPRGASLLQTTAQAMPMTYIDLASATIEPAVTLAHLHKGLPVGFNNTLFYLPGSSAISGTNVVVGSTAGALELTSGAPFFAPRAFTATSAKLIRSTTAGTRQALVLPFAVAKAGEISELLAVTAHNNGTIEVESVESIAANTPMLATLETASTLTINSTVSVEATPSVLTQSGSGYSLTGVYTSAKAPTGSYIFSGDTFTPTPASTTVSPFGVYATLEGATTGKINVITSIADATASPTEAAPVSVFAIDGRLVRSAVSPTQATQGLAPGIYIVGSKKVVVK